MTPLKAGERVEVRLVIRAIGKDAQNDAATPAP